MRFPFLIETLAGTFIAVHAISASSDELISQFLQIAAATPKKILAE
jgi:hypothetical protein